MVARRMPVVALLALLTVAQAQDEPTYTLRYQPKVGQKWMLHTVSTTITNQQLLTGPIHSTTDDLERWERWEVLSVDEQGAATIRNTISRYRTTTTVDGQVKRQTGTALATATPEWQAVSQIMAGRSYTFTLDPLGQVIAVNGLEEIMADVKAKTVNAFTNPLDKQLLDMVLSAMYSKQAILKTLSSRFCRYPKDAVPAEQTWPQDEKIDLELGSLTCVQDLQLAKENAADGSRRLLIDGTWKFKNSGRLPTPLEMSDGYVKGEVTIDPETGFPRSVKQDQGFRLRAFLDNNGMKQPIMDMHMVMREVHDYLAIH